MDVKVEKNKFPILYYDSIEINGVIKYTLHLTYYVRDLEKSEYVQRIKIDCKKNIFSFLLKNNEIINFNIYTRFLAYDGCPKLSYLYQYPMLLTNSFIDT